MISTVTANKYAQAIGFMQPNGEKTMVRTDSKLSSMSSKDTDAIDISSDGRQASLISTRLLSGLNKTMPRMPSKDNFLALTSQTENKLQKLYEQLGISANSQMEFSVDYDGAILVNGQSPDADALAEAINDNDELANSIRGMSAMASVLAAVKKHQEFSEAYAKDPIAAVDRFGYLLEDGHDYHVTFSMLNGHIDTNVAYI